MVMQCIWQYEIIKKTFNELKYFTKYFKGKNISTCVAVTSAVSA